MSSAYTSVAPSASWSIQLSRGSGASKVLLAGKVAPCTNSTMPRIESARYLWRRCSSMPGSSAGTRRSSLRTAAPAANAGGAATSHAASSALTTAFDIVEVLPRAGLDGCHLPAGSFETQAEPAVPGLEGHGVPVGIVLVRLDLQALTIDLPQLGLAADDVRAAQRVQPRLAAQLDAHHAPADDHEVEVRRSALVAQVAAVAGRRAALLARPVRELEHLLHRHAG